MLADVEPSGYLRGARGVGGRGPGRRHGAEAVEGGGYDLFPCGPVDGAVGVVFAVEVDDGVGGRGLVGEGVVEGGDGRARADAAEDCVAAGEGAGDGVGEA